MTRRAQALTILESFRAFSQTTLKVSLWANAVQAAVIVLLSAAAALLAARPDAVEVPVAVDPQGKVYPVVPLNGATLDTTQIKTWFAGAAIDCLTLGPNDFRRQLERCRENFTPRGFESWLKELERSHVQERIVEGLNVSEAVPAGPAVIREKGEHRGRLSFVLELPARVTFSLGREYQQYDWVIEGLVLRVPRAENRRGMAIERIRVTPRKEDRHGPA